MYYGFKLAVALWVFYGLTLGLKAGAWGFFAPEIIADLGLSAAEIGLVAGVVLGGTAVFMPIAGLYISRYGCKNSMVVGLVLGFLGILVTSISTPLYQFVIGAILLAASTSFAGIIPIQTLTTHWFHRYRSRMLALIFTATPIWGAVSYVWYEAMLGVMGWRGSMATLMVIFPLGWLITFFVVKNTPGEIGQTIDGLAAKSDAQPGDASSVNALAPEPEDELDHRWTTKSALRSPIFALITLSVVICTLPYLYFVTYGRLLLEAGGVSTDIAVAALASLTLATLVGRVSASLADFVDARLLVMAAMLSNLAGMTLITNTQTEMSVYISVFLMGASFGLSFLIAPILLARYFGKTVFATVEAVRVSVVVGLNAGLTPLFGYLVDLSGSYFLPLTIIQIVNGVSIAALLVHLIYDRVLKKRSSDYNPKAQHE